MNQKRNYKFSWELRGDLELGRLNLGASTAWSMESFTGQPFKVTDVDGWYTSDRTCRFAPEIEVGELCL